MKKPYLVVRENGLPAAKVAEVAMDQCRTIFEVEVRECGDLWVSSHNGEQGLQEVAKFFGGGGFTIIVIR